MEHPSTRQLARYALGEITDEAELTAFEEHLLECEMCSSRALAMDLIGSGSEEGDDKPSLHIAAGTGDVPTTLCGEEGSRNVISEVLLPGLDATVVCSRCLTLLRGGSGRIN